MKKLFVWFLALALGFSLAACGGKPETAQTTTTITSTEVTETTQESESPSDLPAQDESGTGAEGELPALPTDTAGIVAYYNAALGKTMPKAISRPPPSNPFHALANPLIHKALQI